MDPTPPGPQALRTRDWTRTIDRTWRRTSYTGLTAGTHDESPAATNPGRDRGVTRSGPHQISPMAALPGGTTFGNLVHSVMERIDPRGPDWMDALRAECATALGRWPIPDITASDLAESLAPSIQTPLGPLAEGTTPA